MTADISKKFIFILIASVLLFSVVTASVSASGAFESIINFFKGLFEGKGITGHAVAIDCSLLSGARKDSCYLFSAIKKSNSDDCPKIASTSKMKDICYFAIAAKSKSAALCDSISSNNTKNRCKSVVK